MTGTCTPLKDHFREGAPEIRRKIIAINGHTYLRMNHGCAQLWDGQPEHWTAYA